MTATIILWTVLGWLFYWIVKVPSTIKGDSPINTISDFFTENWKLFALSIIGMILVCTGGNEALPASWGKIDTPYAGFITGGSMPSIIMNVVPLFNKKP